MHTRRFLCLLLGLWLGGSWFMAFVATQNFRSVDRVLQQPAPQAAEQIKAMGGPGAARVFLRYSAGEQNRWYFEVWEMVQLVLALGLFFTLLFGSSEGKLSLGIALVLLLTVVLQRFVMTPEISALGRTLDFQGGKITGEYRRFWMLHGAYSGIEILKWLVILGFGTRLVISSGGRRRSRHFRQEFDGVDKGNYRHVDG